MTLWGKFQALPYARKVLIAIAVLVPVSLLLGPLVSVLALPLIGFSVAHNSWREGRTSKDKIAYVALSAAALLVAVILITLQNSIFQTDWEGGNPLDNLIAMMTLLLMLLLAVIWTLLGWALQRLIQRFKK